MFAETVKEKRGSEKRQAERLIEMSGEKGRGINKKICVVSWVLST